MSVNGGQTLASSVVFNFRAARADVRPGSKCAIMTTVTAGITRNTFVNGMATDSAIMAAQTTDITRRICRANIPKGKNGCVISDTNNTITFTVIGNIMRHIFRMINGVGTNIIFRFFVYNVMASGPV